jgi:hypothetical protein
MARARMNFTFTFLPLNFEPNIRLKSIIQHNLRITKKNGCLEIAKIHDT